MIVYAESNFVLELGLLQEQSPSCSRVLELAESGAIDLAVPAFSLVEPYWTLAKNHARRKEIKAKLDLEIQQIARTAGNASGRLGLRSLAAVLVDSANDEMTSLEQIRERLLHSARVIALNAEVVAAAAGFQRQHDLSCAPISAERRMATVVF